MNEAELRERFSVDAFGYIVDRGKFEHEPLYVPALWDMCGDDAPSVLYDPFCGAAMYYLHLNKLETWLQRLIACYFTELEPDTVFTLYEDTLGFVICDDWPLSEFQAWQRGLDRESGEVA